MAVQNVKPQPLQEKFLQSSADICIFGGAMGGGKTWSLLLEPLYHIDNPYFGAVIFRRTSPQIKQQGGIWDQSCKVYPQLGAAPNKTDLNWTFPSGARVKFGNLQHDINVFDWHSSEICLLEFDELTLFTERMFWYMLSRNRSTCGVKPYVRAGCNADADSWVAKLLEWWIDQDTGLPIPERTGKLRWFVRVDEQLVWADDPEVLLHLHPDLPPQSLSFVPAKLSDNAALMAADPRYLANLLAQPLVERERNLGGNWKIRALAGLVFNRAWFEIVQAAPADTTWLRWWDKAGTTKKKSDWTAGVKVGRDEDGVYYIGHVERGQWRSLDRNKVIKQTAAIDGTDCEIGLEQEPGSAGLESAEISIRDLAGYNVHAEPTTGDKLTLSRPFSAQCEGRNVKIVAGDWNEAFLAELHSFTGADGRVDDQVDACCKGFNKLANAFLGGWDTSTHPDNKSDVAKMPRGVFEQDGKGYNDDGDDEDRPKEDWWNS